MKKRVPVKGNPLLSCPPIGALIVDQHLFFEEAWRKVRSDARKIIVEVGRMDHHFDGPSRFDSIKRCMGDTVRIKLITEPFGHLQVSARPERR